MSIILASGSPRRKELMEMLGVKDLKIIPAQGEEKAAGDLPPAELVMALASHKAHEVAAICGAEDVVLAAAKEVTLSCDESGAAAAIRRWALG